MADNNPLLLSYTQHLLGTLKIPDDKQIFTTSIVDKAKQIQTLALEKKYITRFPIYSLHSKISYSFMPASLQKASKFLGAILSIVLELLLFIFIEPFRMFYNNYHEKERQKMQENFLSQIQNEHMTRIQESKKETPFREPTPLPVQPLSPSTQINELTPSPSQPLSLSSSTQQRLNAPNNMADTVRQLLQKKDAPPPQDDPIAKALGQSIFIVKSKKSSSYVDIALKELTETFPYYSEFYDVLQKIYNLLVERQKKHGFTNEATPIDKNELLRDLKKNFPRVDHAHLKLLVSWSSLPSSVTREGFSGFEKVYNLFLTTMQIMQKIIDQRTFITTKKQEIYALMNEPLQERNLYTSSSSSPSSSSNTTQINEIQSFFINSLFQSQNPYVLSITCESSCPKINTSVTNQTYIPPENLGVSFMNVDSTYASAPLLFGKPSSLITEKTLDLPIGIEYKDKDGQLIIRFSVTVECSIKEHTLSAILKGFNYPDV